MSSKKRALARWQRPDVATVRQDAVALTNATLAVASAVAGLWVASPLLAIAGPSVGMLLLLLQTLPRRRRERWVAGLLDPLSDPIAAEELGKLLRDDEYRSMVEDAIRKSREAVCDEAVPALIELTKAYQHQPQDPFFRGTARVLSEVNSFEFQQLQRIVAGLAARFPGPSTAVRVGAVRPGSGGRLKQHVGGMLVEFSAPERDGQVLATTDTTIPDVPSAPRLLWLLHSNELAFDLGGMGAVAAQAAWMEQDTIERLNRVLQSG